MSRIDRRFARLQRGLQPSRALLAILAIALFPSIASANAGTPLMWATMLHLTFGNAIIGLIEGLLLWRLFQAPRWKSIWVLVIANFASAWAGGFLIVGRLSSIVEITIENIQGWFWLFVALAFVITLLVEFPFFWFALREKQDPVRRALKATSIVHGISYLLLFGWYWAASGTSMLTQLEVVSAGEIRPAAEYALYFITPDGGRIVRSDLEGVEKEVVTTISATHRNDRLFARQDAEGRFDLCVHLDSDERDNQKEELIMEDFSSAAPIEWRIAEGYAEKSEGTWFNFGSVPTLASDTAWEYWTGFWPLEGIGGTNEEEDLRFRFSLETPFAAWVVRNATHLEGDLVVFQLGGDQICIMDPQKRKIAMIAKGKGPIVAEPKTSSKAVQATAASAVPGVSACSARKCEDSVAAGEWYVRETVLHTVTVRDSRL